MAGDKGKDTYFKVIVPDLFYGDRKKFKSYYTQVRLYLWNDFKRKPKSLKTLPEEVMWVASYFREKIFARFQPYIEYYLKRGNVASCDLVITAVIDTVGHYLHLLL
jgi:hypothetical protein